MEFINTFHPCYNGPLCKETDCFKPGSDGYNKIVDEIRARCATLSKHFEGLPVDEQQRVSGLRGNELGDYCDKFSVSQEG